MDSSNQFYNFPYLILVQFFYQSSVALLVHSLQIEVKIYRSEKIIQDHDFALGTIISDKKEIKIAVRDGFLKILDLKLAGKRRMDTRSLLNGYTFDKVSKML